MNFLGVNREKRILPVRIRLIITFLGSLTFLPFGMLYSARDSYFCLVFSTVIFELYAWIPYFFKILQKENIINKWLVITTGMAFLLSLFIISQLLFLLSVIIYTANYISYYLPVKVNYSTLTVQFTEEVIPINYCFKNKFFVRRFMLFFLVNLLLFYLLSIKG